MQTFDFLCSYTVHFKVLCKRTVDTYWETGYRRPCFFFLDNAITGSKCLKPADIWRICAGYLYPFEKKSLFLVCQVTKFIIAHCVQPKTNSIVQYLWKGIISRTQIKRGRGTTKTLPVMMGAHTTASAEKAFHFFEFSTGGLNHTMALTELFMSFNRVGQLYYR